MIYLKVFTRTRTPPPPPSSLFLLVNPIRTVNWPDLLPKIALNINSTSFQSIGTGREMI